MNFKITEHYARGEEKLIAEFNELNDAKLFLTKKSSIDDMERKKVIYRLYDDHELLHELNKENISITHAKYADGNGDFNNAAPFIFQVMIKTMDSLERKTIAQFNDKNDAKLFVACKFEDDNTSILLEWDFANNKSNPIQVVVDCTKQLFWKCKKNHLSQASWKEYYNRGCKDCSPKLMSFPD